MYITGDDDVQKENDAVSKARAELETCGKSFSVLIVSGWWFFTEIPRGCCGDALATTWPWLRRISHNRRATRRDKIERNLQNCVFLVRSSSSDSSWEFCAESLSRYFRTLDLIITRPYYYSFLKNFNSVRRVVSCFFKLKVNLISRKSGNATLTYFVRFICVYWMSNARENACQIRGFLDGLTPASTQSIWKRTGAFSNIKSSPLWYFFMFPSQPLFEFYLSIKCWFPCITFHYFHWLDELKPVAFATIHFNEGESESELTLEHWTDYASDRMNDKTNSRAIRQTLHAKIFLDEFKLIKRENLRNEGAVIYERTRTRERKRERERERERL